MEKKTDNKPKKNQKQRFEKRSPLQNLNGRLQLHKITSKNPPAALSKVQFTASFSSSSSSRTQLTNNAAKKPTWGASKVCPRSKETEKPTKPFSKKMEKIQPKLDFGKKIANPISKFGERSKLSAFQRNPTSKMMKGIVEKKKKAQGNDFGKPNIELLKVSGNSSLNCVENCTPVGKLACVSGVDLADFDESKNVSEDSMLGTGDGNGATPVRTPPVEASVSPEIQCVSLSKMLVSKSGATPICYGAGHLLSGITDKRKCRRRGSLKGVSGKAVVLSSDGNLISDLRDSSIPLLAGASVRWHLSPCKEERENRGSGSGNQLKQCRMSNDSVTLDLWSSPSSLSRNVSELVCDNSSYSGSGSVEDETNDRKAQINILSPQNDYEFHGFSESSNKKVKEHMLVNTPSSSSQCTGVGSQERKSLKSFQDGNYSALYVGSFSSGNIIQTPNSDSSLEKYAGIDQRSLVLSEPNLISEALERVALSTGTGMLKWDSPDFGSDVADTDSLSKSIDLTQLQKNVDSVSSWESSFTLENLALSQMRISWRDGLVSGIVETEESDYCRCLSDEEIDTDECSEARLMPFSQTKKENDCGTESVLRCYLGSESGANDGIHLGINDDICPKVLDYEPIISSKRKYKKPPHIPNTLAESICTNGDSLVDSGNSDWSYCFSDHLLNSRSHIRR